MFFFLLQELRKEVVELRHTLQQSRAESQVLRDELMKSGGPSADAARYMEEKIQLVKEVNISSHLSLNMYFFYCTPLS